MSYRIFKDLFSHEENDRGKKQLKKDYRALEKSKRHVKFKHLIDYYLSSSEQFGQALKQVDARVVIDALEK